MPLAEPLSPTRPSPDPDWAQWEAELAAARLREPGHPGPPEPPEPPADGFGRGGDDHGDGDGEGDKRHVPHSRNSRAGWLRLFGCAVIAAVSMVVLSAVQGDRPQTPLPTSPSSIVQSAPPAVLSQAPLPVRAERTP